jgi:DNA-binding NarL/FixJ family response regulator
MRSLRADAAEVPSPPAEPAGLSPWERDVLAPIGDGLANREIDKRLYLSEKTVRHISRLLAKPGVRRRIHAGSPRPR